jgi:DNA polymerase-3 subunit epsilon
MSMKSALNLKNPLCFFDLETTGTNITQDRIVELAVLKVMPNGDEFLRVHRVNPGIPISPESTRIHGISDADVAGRPMFKDIARELGKFFEGCDLAGFAILKFDIPMLVEEFLRAGVEFDVSRKKIIDTQRIYHLMEKRTLSAAYRFYLNKDLTDAHSAEADARASLEVLAAQVELYQGQPVTDHLGNPIGRIENDMEVLNKLSSSELVDLAGRMIRNTKGEVLFNFGKHKNKKVLDVLRDEPSYYDWVMNGDFPIDTKRKLTEVRLSSMRS